MKEQIRRFWKYVILSFSVLVFVTGSYAANISNNAGTTTGEFLRLGAGARATGMGEAFSAIADDVHSIYWNPAGLSKVTNHQTLLAHTFWYVDVYHEYAAYVYPINPEWGAAGVSITYLGTTFEKRAGDTDTPDSTGSIGDLAIGLSYGRKVIWDINAGITAKYINSRLDTYSAGGFGIDLGLQGYFPWWDRLMMGLTVTNILASLKYIDESFPVGKTVDFGLAVKDLFFNNLNITTDLRLLTNMSYFSANFGAEYIWNISEEWSFSPRAGFKTYNTQISAGFGARFQSYQLDYAFIPHADLGGAHRISFGIKF